MPVEYGTAASSVVDVSSSQVDLVSETENWSENATIYVKNNTGTLLVRFFAKPYEGCKLDWVQIGDDITQEPSTTEVYTAPDTYGTFKVAGVRSGSTDTEVETYVCWQPIEKRQKPKWDKGSRPSV